MIHKAFLLYNIIPIIHYHINKIIYDKTAFLLYLQYMYIVFQSI